MVGQSHDSFTLLNDGQGSDGISALSAGCSSAVNEVQTWDTLKQTSSNMFLCPLVSDKLKSAEILHCCPSQQCRSLMTLSGQKGRWMHERISLIYYFVFGRPNSCWRSAESTSWVFRWSWPGKTCPKAHWRSRRDSVKYVHTNTLTQVFSMGLLPFCTHKCTSHVFSMGLLPFCTHKYTSHTFSIRSYFPFKSNLLWVY
jgi:hypothetical protein